MIDQPMGHHHHPASSNQGDDDDDDDGWEYFLFPVLAHWGAPTQPPPKA
jgi:hypothetical protein